MEIEFKKSRLGFLPYWVGILAAYWIMDCFGMGSWPATFGMLGGSSIVYWCEK